MIWGHIINPKARLSVLSESRKVSQAASTEGDVSERSFIMQTPSGGTAEWMHNLVGFYYELIQG